MIGGLRGKGKRSGILSLRSSVIVWVCGGILGWAAAIFVVYTSFNLTRERVAEGELPPDALPEDRFADDAAGALSDIAPAAGQDEAGDIESPIVGPAP